MEEMKKKLFISDNTALMEEWDWEKNGELSPYELTLGSGKKIWWKCANGHEWDDSILHRTQGRNCPYCSNHRILIGYNNLFATNPELEIEWDYSRNTNIDPNAVTNGSHEKAWWQCSNGHSFEKVIRARAKGSGCPYCGNKKIIQGFNDLATVSPALAMEWNYERNIAITPYEVGEGSKRKVWWVCENGHEWEATVTGRSRGKGCPYCSNRRIKKGYNDLETIHPEISLEWDYEKNNGLLPSEVSSANNKKLWWLCKNGHSWEATILNRHQGNGCPICTNQKVLIGYNDLATTHPELAAEWNYEKNGNLLPTSVVAGSAKKVWWIGQCGHEWEAVIGSRCTGRGCPICAAGLRISFPEKCVYFYVKKYFPEAEENVRLPSLQGLELDIYLPSLNTGIEYDGKHWHTNLGKDLQKDNLCSKSGIKLYRIRELGCAKFKNETWLEMPDNGIESLEEMIVLLLNRLNIKVQRTDIDIERDRWTIYSVMQLPTAECSVEELYPELAKQWHPVKNGKLEPWQFAISSRKKAWWLGDCGHEWEAPIHSRVAGSGCPYCSNKRLLPGFNDLATTHPQLLSEWDYEKNNISPKEIFAGSETLIWWKCEKGHEWQTYPYRRKTGENCPYCSNHRVLAGYNDLATLNPELVEEWDFEKNELSPSEIMAGSNKNAWWKCKECGHEWKAPVAARTRGRGCKKCANRKLSITMKDRKTTQKKL